MQKSPEFVSIAIAAQLTGISPTQLRRLEQRGQFPPARLVDDGRRHPTRIWRHEDFAMRHSARREGSRGGRGLERANPPGRFATAFTPDGFEEITR